jgi:hypothetical protein
MIPLKPYLQQPLKGQIWRMLIDSYEQLLYIETRDAENRLAVFWGFDLSNGTTAFSNLSLDEKWLTGMDGCFNGVLFLHGYQSAQSPVHKGIIAIEGNTGNILWQNYTLAMDHISVNGPVAYNTQVQPVKLFLLDALTGATLREYKAPIDTDLETDIKYPATIELVDEAFKPFIDGDVVGNIHYMEHNSFRIVSLHTLNKAELKQVLLIMQGSNLVYDDLLTGQIQKLQPEAFIMQQNRLIYIKNKVELKVLNL